MRTRTAATTALALLAAGLLAACNPNATDAKNAGPSSPRGAATGTTAAHKPVPNLVGKGLQAAQDAAQAQGFYDLTSHDSLGRDRHQILDRDWKVCSQKPAAGTGMSTSTKLDLGAVKTTETCPRSDQAPPEKTGRTMPNFVGKGLAPARDSLPSDASVTVKDATGSRVIILESDWTVCSQNPKAGAAYTGQPVNFTAVKSDETCP